MARALIDYFVLDTLANDVESLEDILRLINHPELGWCDHHGGRIAREDVVAALVRLIRSGLVDAYGPAVAEPALVPLGEGVAPAGDWGGHYFGLTARGRMVHGSWEPPEAPASETEPLH